MQRLPLVMLMALAPTACLPPAEDAGEIDPTESNGTSSGATATGSNDESFGTEGAPADPGLDASLELPPDLSIFFMLRTPDGILVALQGDLSVPGYDAEIREYSSSLELLWSQTIPDAFVSDLEALGGGEFLASGLSIDSSGLVAAEPAVWRVSCCSEVTSQIYPHPAENVWVSGADLREEGLLLVVREIGSPFEMFWDTTFLQVPLDLGPATDLGTETIEVLQSARTPAGTVLLRQDCGTTSDCVVEYGPDGPGDGSGFEGRLRLVGKGDELTLMAFDDDEVQIQRFGEDEWVPVATPGFALHYDEEGFQVDRHERVVLVHHESAPDGASELRLVEFEDDGTVARSLTVPPVQQEITGLGAMIVGEDGAIYLAVTEATGDDEHVKYLHRIAPL